MMVTHRVLSWVAVGSGIKVYSALQPGHHDLACGRRAGTSGAVNVPVRRAQVGPSGAR